MELQRNVLNEQDLQSSGCVREWVESMPDDWLRDAWDLLRNTTGHPVDSDFAHSLFYVCNNDEAIDFTFANDVHRQIVTDWLETHKQDFFNLLSREIERGKKARQIARETDKEVIAARELLQSHGYTIVRKQDGHLL